MSGLKVYDALGREKHALVSSAPVIVKGARTTNTGALAANYNGPLAIDEVTDTDGLYNGTRFQPTKPGYYRVASQLCLSSATVGIDYQMFIVKNGLISGSPQGNEMGSGFMRAQSTFVELQAVATVFLNGTTDFVEVFVWLGTAGAILRGDTSPKTLLYVESVAPVGPIAAGGPPPLVSSLPGAGTVPDGFEVYYAADPANGVLWHLRYNAAAAKWDAVGTPAFIETALFGGSNTLGGGSSYSTQLVDGTGIVKMSPPLAGDYWVYSRCVGVANDGTVRNASAGVLKAGDASPDVSGKAVGYCGTPTGGGWANLWAEGRINGVVAGTDKLFMAYLYTAAVIAYSNRQFGIRPIRVGP